MPEPKPYTAKDGTVTYRVRFRMGGRQCSETFATRRAAQIFCNDVEARGAEAAVRMRDDAEKERRAPTLDAMSRRWLEHRTGRVRSDRTIADYARDYRRHISPTLGHLSVATITTGDVQGLVESWVDAGLAPRTILGYHAILHGIIKHAMTQREGQWVEADPCVGIDLPRKRKTPPKALRPGEWAALHVALRQIDNDAADLSQFLVASGLRWSEAVALDGWSVDDLGTIVTVTVGRVLRRNAAGQHVIVDDVKDSAGSSARTVKLDPGTSVMVRARAERAGPGLLFTNRNGNQWHYSNFTDRAWRPAIALANLERKPTVHWLRHTATVWALHSGASLADVQARLGHSSITTTIGTYGSSITDVGDDVLTGLARLVSGSGVPALD